MHFGPAIDGAGNGHRVDAFAGHSLHALLGQEGRRQTARRRTGAVQAGQFSGLGIPVDSEHVSTQTVHQRFGYGQDCIGGDGCVDRRSAAGENLRAGLRGENLTGGDDSLLADNHGPAIIPAHAGTLCLESGERQRNNSDGEAKNRST